MADCDRLMSYVAYYVSRGKTVISLMDGPLPFTGPVYQYRGYHSYFSHFWWELKQRRDFHDLHMESDNYSFGDFLGNDCTVGECSRCDLPIPIPDGLAYTVPNCTLCDNGPLLAEQGDSSIQVEGITFRKRYKHPATASSTPVAQAQLAGLQPTFSESDLGSEFLESEDSFDLTFDLTQVVAVGTPPTDRMSLEEVLSLNGFDVTFVSKPEEVTCQSWPRTVDLVLIHAEVSEKEGKTWAQELHRHPQIQNAPVVALSAEAGGGLPWVERTLGVVDYVVAPLNGDRLAHRLRQVLQAQHIAQGAEIHWFPR
ncbi:two-component system response regulator [Leptolyngbya sp. FACHB-261]|uniref:response regulator n=1 Tax=Leptolyngbya sp. FACHB-261 TaxID=2692806 RepID=UPI001685A5EB|nr:hypothetical protein [Leptolyngbya sp. FACHB-261]MBD2100471.1 hypothetical protein [Leptolyngbya sp. FACHB-261]